MDLLRGAAVLVGSVMIVATAVPLLRANAWWIRVFDFPRLQITIISAVALAVFMLAWERASAWHNAFVAPVSFKRLPAFGSDHFPVGIKLSYEPGAAATQEAPHDTPQAST